MLGLKRGTVALLPHQAEWDRSAEEVGALLRQVLGAAAVDVQHVGSTAIPAIRAKPIVDLVVAVERLEDLEPYGEALARAGFLDRGSDQPGQRLWVRTGADGDTRTHHIHVVEAGSQAYAAYLAFRDYLNAFPEKAREYEACKEALAAAYPQDRGAYTAGKAACVARLGAEARAWRAKAAEAGEKRCIPPGKRG